MVFQLWELMPPEKNRSQILGLQTAVVHMISIHNSKYNTSFSLSCLWLYPPLGIHTILDL